MRLAHSGHSPARVLGPPAASRPRPRGRWRNQGRGSPHRAQSELPKARPLWKTSRQIPPGSRPWAGRPPPREGPGLPSCAPAHARPDLAPVRGDDLRRCCRFILWRATVPRSILQMEIPDGGRGAGGLGAVGSDHAGSPGGWEGEERQRAYYPAAPEFSRWEILLGNLGFQRHCSQHPVRLARAPPHTQWGDTARSRGPVRFHECHSFIPGF